MNLQRITRLLKLLQTLQSGNGQNADGLAKACGVSRRTIFRDLETLRSAGVPLKFDADEDRYLIPGSFFLPPTNFTAEEALAVIALASELGAEQGVPFFEPARRAALKLESGLPGPLRAELRDVTHAIKIRAGQLTALKSRHEIYDELLQAIAKRTVVRIDYQSLTEWELISTKLRPYQLLFSRHSWYVIGRSSLHSEVRTFNVARIRSLKRLREKYTIPRGFSLERHLGNAWHLMPESGRDHNIHVRFKQLVARNVAEVVWHRTQRAEFREDGDLDFYARVSGLNEVSWWILGYGDQAEVIKPVKLRRLVAQRAANMHATYNGATLLGNHR